MASKSLNSVEESGPQYAWLGFTLIVNNESISLLNSGCTSFLRHIIEYEHIIHISMIQIRKPNSLDDVYESTSLQLRESWQSQKRDWE